MSSYLIRVLLIITILSWWMAPKPNFEVGDCIANEYNDIREGYKITAVLGTKYATEFVLMSLSSETKIYQKDGKPLSFNWAKDYFKVDCSLLRI